MKPSVCRLSAVYGGLETAFTELAEVIVSQSERVVICKIKFMIGIMQLAAQVDQSKKFDNVCYLTIDVNLAGLKW